MGGPGIEGGWDQPPALRPDNSPSPKQPSDVSDAVPSSPTEEAGPLLGAKGHKSKSTPTIFGPL